MQKAAIIYIRTNKQKIHECIIRLNLYVFQYEIQQEKTKLNIEVIYMPIQRYVINTGFWLCDKSEIELYFVCCWLSLLLQRCRVEFILYVGAMFGTHTHTSSTASELHIYPYTSIILVHSKLRPNIQFLMLILRNLIWQIILTTSYNME